MTREDQEGCRVRSARIFHVLVATVLWLSIGMERSLAETQSVIDPTEIVETPKPPVSTTKKQPQPDAAIRRERQRAEEEKGKRAKAEARAQAAESEAAKLRAVEQARQADAAAKAAATKKAARKAAASRAEAAKLAKTRSNAEKEAAEREAKAKEAAAREAVARETAAREASAREAAAREAAAREAAAKEAAAREAAVREADAKEAEAREAAAKLAAVREAATRETRRPGAQRRFATVFRDCADCPEVVWMPQREFAKGEPSAAGGPRTTMKISDMLAVGRFKVTFAEWDACVVAGGCRRRPDASRWSRERQPVTNINWADAQQYAAWLSRRTKKPYRLLTGSEWEYAARTGSDVYDMHDNAPEWIADCHQYRNARSDGTVWTLDCTTLTVRGGGGNGPTNSTRSVPRPFAPLNENRIGFRIARTE